MWFGKKPFTLFWALDDATGKALGGLFAPRETVPGAFLGISTWIAIPSSLPLDTKQSAQKPTAFQVAMAELGIGLIYAHSPQARGRIERSFRTFQDRLVKELALKGINDPEEANRYLREVFIPRYNRKFAVEAEEPEKAWRKPPENLKEILSRRLKRKVKGDFTISVEGKTLQLKPPRFTIRLSGVKVEVRELFDGSFRIYHPSGEVIPYEELGKPEKGCQKIKLRLKTQIQGFPLAFRVTFSLCSNSILPISSVLQTLTGILVLESRSCCEYKTNPAQTCYLLKHGLS